MALKFYIEISYNVGYGAVPVGVSHSHIGKPFVGANHLCQGLYTKEFLKEALPTLQLYSECFGITLNNGVYTVTNRVLFDQWREFTPVNFG